MKISESEVCRTEILEFIGRNSRREVAKNTVEQLMKSEKEGGLGVREFIASQAIADFLKSELVKEVGSILENGQPKILDPPAYMTTDAGDNLLKIVRRIKWNNKMGKVDDNDKEEMEKIFGVEIIRKGKQTGVLHQCSTETSHGLRFGLWSDDSIPEDAIDLSEHTDHE